MSDAHDAHDIQKSVRRYLMVFGALIVGTFITVGMYYVRISSIPATIAVALFIASIKGFLVAGYFMHLISEKKLIYSVLAATAFFFAGMMFLTIWGRDSLPVGSYHLSDPVLNPSSESSATHP